MRRIVQAAGVFAAMAVFSQGALAQPKELPIALGAVYLCTEGGIPSESALHLLSESCLDQKCGWVRVGYSKREREHTIATFACAACEQGVWVTKPSRITLGATCIRTEEVIGENALPEVLNRPLTGSISNRIEEVRVLQLRNQASAFLAECRNGHTCEVCTRVTYLVNPRLVFSGYQSAEQVRNLTATLARMLGGPVPPVVGPNPDGTYYSHLEREVPIEVKYRPLADSEPRFGSDRIFYLKKASSVTIVVDWDKEMFVLVRQK